LNNNNNSNRNNNNNNRRRGRGNNRQQGGGNQNRIDSRARGNAPQMLDKYRKLAQDAQHNGDRVQAEYYLQFADHYFRVIADSRPRPEEQRGGRRDEPDFANEEDGEEDDFGAPRQSRDDRPRDDRPREDRPRDDRSREDRPREDRPREDRPRQDGPRDDRPREARPDRARNDRQRQPREQDTSDTAVRETGPRASENGGAGEYEPAENPFVRPSRNRNREARGTRVRADETTEMTGNEGEIDAAALPPSFSTPAETTSEGEPEAERATRKLPPRRRRKPADEGGDPGDNLTAVG
jgi:hypothetical protein